MPVVFAKFIVCSQVDGRELQMTRMTRRDEAPPMDAYLLNGEEVTRIDDDTFETAGGERFKRQPVASPRS